ncbi:hypothetical protein DEGR_38720 (plasmid) [Deinococcus grandis]|nr:hypothetical protein DEGR_38720 [Deinococcus grandis]
MSPEAVWPPELPEVVLDWPVPRGVKIRPARWVGGDAANYRAHFQAAVEAGMVLAVICNDAPRGPRARVTRWFCPGVPMHVTGWLLYTSDAADEEGMGDVGASRTLKNKT